MDRSNPNPGYIQGYPPGVRENGGQYTHGAVWAGWAFCRLGRGNRAGELLHLLNPIYHADTPDQAQRYRMEPYVMAADVYSAPQHLGRGGWTWYTGSAAWFYRLALEAVLGLGREGQTLWIDPVIPAHWPGYQVHYRFGRACYRIHVRNPDGVERGVRSITVDGQEAPGGEIALLDDGEEHEVEVEMGH
jgi:cellobiose phosphorylase